MYLSKRKKSGIYYIYFRKDDGKKTRVSTKTKIKSEALKFLSQFEKRVKQKTPKSEISLGDFAFLYLKSISVTHTNESYRLTKRLIEKFRDGIGKDKLLKELDQTICEGYILKVYAKAKHHGALLLRHFKAFFNKAIEWGYLENNPLKQMKLRVPENHPTFISLIELKKIIDKEDDSMYKLIYEFAFYTGLRISEIINLEWSDIDLGKGEMKIQNKEGYTTKSKRERIVPMNEKVKYILSQQLNNSNYIFNVKGEQIKKIYLSKRFKECVRDAKLNERIHFHTLRHSFASTLVQKGVNLFYVQKLLGHSQISTTQRYSHLRQQDLVNAINTLN